MKSVEVKTAQAKVAYLDCFSGISGDMFLAALVDAGVPFAVLGDAVASLDVGAKLDLRRVDRSGINSAKIEVLTAERKIAQTAYEHTQTHDGETHSQADSHEDSHSHEHDHSQSHSQEHDHRHPHEHSHAESALHVHGRSLSAIERIIRGSSLPLEVKAIALKAFHLLGHAEAKIHNVPIESVHFHEVGAVDAIADIVAVSTGCHWLQVDRWMCSPLNVGGGHMHCVHGKFPVPAPATLELLHGLPIYSSGVMKELVTPTGAALLRALDVTSSSFPSMSVTSTGYGAGSKDVPGQPNVLRLVIGESTAPGFRQASEFKKGRVGIIETTIDDATPELLSYVADRLLAAGASDVYRTPVQMKKGRSGVHLTILCRHERAAALQKIVFQETTTLGLRYREEEKTSLARSFTSVETQWGEIRIKIGMFDGEIVNYAPEFEDCREIAERHAVPLKQVMQAAVSAYLAQGRPA